MTQWQKVRVGEFLFERKEKYQPNDEKITGLSRINKIDFSGNFHIAQKPSNTKMILICPDDLVISGINVAKGAMGIYRGDKNIVATIHYSSYTFDEKKINVSYFKRFLKSAEFVKLLQEQVKGGIKTEIKPKHLLPLEINLPDIKEQKIIVKKLKAIETEENELKQEIAQQQILLKNLRQQILQEAIEGKLTQDWRVKNPNTEPASELLKRIQAEKQQLIKDKKIKAQKPLPAISEDEKPFKLPDGWVWCRLNDILSEILGGHSFKSSLFKKYGEKQVLRLGNIRPYHVRLERNSVYIDEKTANKARSAKLKQGDILITMTGTRGKRDYCYTVLLNELHFKDRELYLNQRVGCLRFNKYVSLKYYDYCLKNNRLLDQIFSTATGSANQANIGISALISWLIPMPSTQEQKTIVAKVEKLLNICDKLQTQITANQIYAEQLMQAVLKEAFTQAEQPI